MGYRPPNGEYEFLYKSDIVGRAANEFSLVAVVARNDFCKSIFSNRVTDKMR
jgi:hypothetical protein